MLFGCCHPALSVEVRLALTLRAVVGVSDRGGARSPRSVSATSRDAGCQGNAKSWVETDWQQI
jgi:hypothetical protein